MDALTRLRQILSGRWFPEYVFSDRRERFFFFDPDWVFRPEFLETARMLLDIDGAPSLILANLDKFPSIRTFQIDRTTTMEDYRPQLADFEAWRLGLSDFACLSDRGPWCIFGEGQNEVAVIAFAHAADVEQYRPVLDQLRAAPIEEALERPLTYVYGRLVPECRDGLLRHYSHERLQATADPDER